MLELTYLTSNYLCCHYSSVKNKNKIPLWYLKVGRAFQREVLSNFPKTVLCLKKTTNIKIFINLFDLSKHPAEHIFPGPNENFVSDNVLTFYVRQRWHYLGDPARGQGGRKGPLGGAAGDTNISPAVWSQSGPTPREDSSTHQAETPTGKKKKEDIFNLDAASLKVKINELLITTHIPEVRTFDPSLPSLTSRLRKSSMRPGWVSTATVRNSRIITLILMSSVLLCSRVRNASRMAAASLPRQA